jgi:anti-sigma regulatory factor (Ser/Thr protein kinase)
VDGRPRISAALRGDLYSPKAARDSVEELRDAVDCHVVETAQLLISELVTNAVKHGNGGDHELRVWLYGARLRMEVSDGGVGFDPRTPTDGWGLSLVDRLADDWGVINGPGAHVWCELDLKAAVAY